MTSAQADSTPTPMVAGELRTVWSELLFVESVGEHDNFVALGGDSIAATVCTMRIKVAFGVEVAASFLLQDDTDFAMLVHEVEARMAHPA